jgi:hypothetical protein
MVRPTHIDAKFFFFHKTLSIPHPPQIRWAQGKLVTGSMPGGLIIGNEKALGCLKNEFCNLLF